MFAYLHHECVRRVDEVGHVALGRALEAELAVGGHRVVHEDDGRGESAVVQDLAVVLAQLAAALRLEAELVLERKVVKLVQTGYLAAFLCIARTNDIIA